MFSDLYKKYINQKTALKIVLLEKFRMTMICLTKNVANY